MSENDSQEKLDKIQNLIEHYGQVDGSHHKMWLIDEIMRVVKGDNYDSWVEDYEEDGEYSWDIGLAP